MKRNKRRFMLSRKKIMIILIKKISQSSINLTSMAMISKAAECFKEDLTSMADALNIFLQL